MAVDTNTIDKDHIKSALLETITTVLSTLPYNNQLECDCVLGIRLDEGTEFFISLHDQIQKIAAPCGNNDVVIDDALPSSHHMENQTSYELSNTTEKQNHVLSVPSLGNLPIGTRFILPSKDAQYLLDVLKKQEALEKETVENTLEYKSQSEENITVHQSFPHFTTEEHSEEYELIQDPVETASQGLPGVGATKIEEVDSEHHGLEYEAAVVEQLSNKPLPAKEHFVEVEVSAGSLPQKESATKMGGRRKFKHIYKVPQGHLNNAPCDCCHILQRYREKDKNVRRRRVVREETGEAPPRQPPSKVYKLPANHHDKCSCCEVLRKKREYWKNLSRRRRSKDKTSSTEPHWIELDRSPV